MTRWQVKYLRRSKFYFWPDVYHGNDFFPTIWFWGKWMFVEADLE